MAQLSPLPIQPPPGVVLTESDRVAQGRWIASVNVRFVKGLPQKIGGNTNAVITPTDGVPRALHAWRDNSQKNYLAAGTYKKLYVYDSSFLQNDITPYIAQGTMNNPFLLTAGSNLVRVVQPLHNRNPGDIVTFSNVTNPLGGLNLNPGQSTPYLPVHRGISGLDQVLSLRTYPLAGVPSPPA